MSDEKMKPPYGTTISRPDEKAGVEVGGGEKAAAAHSKQAREEGDAESVATDEIADGEDAEESQSPT